MTNEQKKQVREALLRYTAQFETQSEAAESLKGVSGATLSQVKNYNWELMSERLWHHIAMQVGFYCGEWQAADTSAYLLLRILFSDAQHYGMTYGIAIAEGLGKTFAARHYVRENDNTYYVAGSEDHNRKTFLTALMNAAGAETGGTMPNMIQRLAEHLAATEEALLIIDDADKLKDRVLHLLVLVTNAVGGRAGIAIMGGSQLRTRIVEGARKKRAGFEEMYQSIGRRVVTLGYAGPNDVEAVCRANGVEDADAISYIKDNCDDNLHVATQLIQQHKEMNRAA